MKKMLIALVVLLLIVLSAVLIFKNSLSLSKKRAYIVEQGEIHEKDLSNLLILKNSPDKNGVETYDIIKPTLFSSNDTYSINTLLYREAYYSKVSVFQTFDMGDLTFRSFSIEATIFFDRIIDFNKEKEMDNHTKKITFQNSEGFFTTSKQIIEEDDIAYMYHQLSFLKENIFYKINYFYLLDKNKKDTFDFIKFLDKNLVPVSK